MLEVVKGLETRIEDLNMSMKDQNNKVSIEIAEVKKELKKDVKELKNILLKSLKGRDDESEMDIPVEDQKNKINESDMIISEKEH